MAFFGAVSDGKTAAFVHAGSQGPVLVATIIDVARHAGVATSTVSHVLNGTRFVSAETTRAVRDAVVAVGYTPNTLARALARSTTNTVGLAISASANRYFNDLINAVEAECSKLGMVVLLSNTHDDPEIETRVVTELHHRRVDGIILAPSCDPNSRALAYLRDKNVPFVLVDRLPDDQCDGVGVENYEAMAEMVRHLATHGHRRIGFLGGQAGFTTAQERARGFADGLRGTGLPVDPTLIAIGHTDIEAARASARRMLSTDNLPTALIGGNNLSTIGIMLAIRDLGLRVPDDVALIGFDDFEWAEAFEPRLTAMVQPCEAIGARAADLLNKRIGSPGADPVTIRLKPELVIRDSCGCVRRDLRRPSPSDTIIPVTHSN